MFSLLKILQIRGLNKDEYTFENLFASKCCAPVLFTFQIPKSSLIWRSCKTESKTGNRNVSQILSERQTDVTEYSKVKSLFDVPGIAILVRHSWYESDFFWAQKVGLSKERHKLRLCQKNTASHREAEWLTIAHLITVLLSFVSNNFKNPTSCLRLLFSCLCLTSTYYPFWITSYK